MEKIKLIRKFNKLNKYRKSLYWQIANIPDDYYDLRVELRKNFSKLKSIFNQFKENKDKLTPEILEKLELNLNKFDKYLKDKFKNIDT